MNDVFSLLFFCLLLPCAAQADAVMSPYPVTPGSGGNVTMNDPWREAEHTQSRIIGFPSQSGISLDHEVELKITNSQPFLREKGETSEAAWVSGTHIVINGGVQPLMKTIWSASSQWNWATKEYDAILRATVVTDAGACSTSYLGGSLVWKIFPIGISAPVGSVVKDSTLCTGGGG